MCDKSAYREAEDLYAEYMRRVEEWKKRQKPYTEEGDEFMGDYIR